MFWRFSIIQSRYLMIFQKKNFGNTSNNERISGLGELTPTENTWKIHDEKSGHLNLC
jgi:hypothetical protein